MQLVSSAENSSLNWRAQYGYIEDIERRARLHRRHHRLLLRHRRHARARRGLHARAARQRARQVPAGAAQGQRHRLARRPRPEVRRAWRRGGQTRRSGSAGGASATASTSTPSVALARPTASARSASSPTTTPPWCTATRACRAIRERALARPAAAAGRRRGHVPRRLPRRARRRDEEGGGARGRRPGSRPRSGGSCARATSTSHSPSAGRSTATASQSCAKARPPVHCRFAAAWY